jgi:hypothetical protein
VTHPMASGTSRVVSGWSRVAHPSERTSTVYNDPYESEQQFAADVAAIEWMDAVTEMFGGTP